MYILLLRTRSVETRARSGGSQDPIPNCRLRKSRSEYPSLSSTPIWEHAAPLSCNNPALRYVYTLRFSCGRRMLFLIFMMEVYFPRLLVVLCGAVNNVFSRAFL